MHPRVSYPWSSSSLLLAIQPLSQVTWWKTTEIRVSINILSKNPQPGYNTIHQSSSTLVYMQTVTNTDHSSTSLQGRIWNPRKSPTSGLMIGSHNQSRDISEGLSPSANWSAQKPIPKMSDTLEGLSPSTNWLTLKSIPMGVLKGLLPSL